MPLAYLASGVVGYGFCRVKSEHIPLMRALQDHNIRVPGLTKHEYHVLMRGTTVPAAIGALTGHIAKVCQPSTGTML